jgi:hypothetical protein
MRNLKFQLFLLIILPLGFISCKEDEQIEDPIFEFVSFKEGTVLLNEKTHSEEPYPLVAKLLAFKPYNEDIELNIEIIGINAVEGVDFIVLPDASKLLIKAGSLVSDTLFLQTIDNDINSGERWIHVTITKTSKPDLKIGLGITEPKNATVRVQIVDDECDGSIEVFNNSTFTNKINGGNTTLIQGSLIGHELTFQGDIIDYAPFSGAKLVVDLVPYSEGSTAGAVSFGEQEVGADSDGYEYKFVQKKEGKYNVCEESVELEFDVLYLDGGDWVYWFTADNILIVQ